MRVSLCTNLSLIAPPPQIMTEYGIDALRTIIYDLDSFDQAFRQLPAEVKIGLLVNNELNAISGENWEGLESALKEIVRRYGSRLLYVEVGNELDIWGLSPQFGADLAKRAAPILRSAGIPCVLASVASGNWVNWLTEASALAGDSIDGVAFHPYGQAPDLFDPDSNGQWEFGKLRVAMATAYQAARLPVYVTEFGVKLRDAFPSLQGRNDGYAMMIYETWQQKYLEQGFRTLASLGVNICPFASYFAYSDAVGAADEQGVNAFGLMRSDRTPRPAWGSFLQAVATYKEPGVATTPTPPPAAPVFVFGFKDWHDLEPTLIGDPLENERGFTPGVSLQKTTNGLLMWFFKDQNGHEVKGFLHNSGKRYRLDQGALASVEVPFQ